MAFFHYDGGVVADQATGRPLMGQPVKVFDEETDAPVQAYREGQPVSLVTGAHGLIPQFQTEDSTRRVRMEVGPVRLRQWCQEMIASAAAVATANLVTEAELAEALEDFTGSGIQEVSGTVMLGSSGPAVREFWTLGETLFVAGDGEALVPSAEAVVASRTSGGEWSLARVPASAWRPLSLAPDEVTALPVTFDNDGLTFSIPNSPDVRYVREGFTIAAGTYSASVGQTVRIAAEPMNGKTLVRDNYWEHTYTQPKVSPSWTPDGFTIFASESYDGGTGTAGERVTDNALGGSEKITPVVTKDAWTITNDQITNAGVVGRLIWDVKAGSRAVYLGVTVSKMPPNGRFDLRMGIGTTGNGVSSGMITGPESSLSPAIKVGDGDVAGVLVDPQSMTYKYFLNGQQVEGNTYSSLEGTHAGIISLTGSNGVVLDNIIMAERVA